METILTVLSTIGVGALAYAFASVIRLSRRVNDLELIRMELVDFEGQFEKQIDNETSNREREQELIHKRMDEEACSLDRRQDKVWSDIHTLNDKVKKLNSTVNPNMDLLK
jgi:hypothetical protein